MVSLAGFPEREFWEWFNGELATGEQNKVGGPSPDIRDVVTQLMKKEDTALAIHHARQRREQTIGTVLLVLFVPLVHSQAGYNSINCFIAETAL